MRLRQPVALPVWAHLTVASMASLGFTAGLACLIRHAGVAP